MVLGQIDGIITGEDGFHDGGIAGDFLLVAAGEGGDIGVDIGQELIDLAVGSSLAPSIRVEDPMLSWSRPGAACPTVGGVNAALLWSMSPSSCLI